MNKAQELYKIIVSLANDSKKSNVLDKIVSVLKGWKQGKHCDYMATKLFEADKINWNEERSGQVNSFKVIVENTSNW